MQLYQLTKQWTMTDLDLQAALNDLQALSLTMHGEARGDSHEGYSSVEERIAVGCVIRNRLNLSKWGTSYHRVCLASLQFSCWTPKGGEENYKETMRLARVLVAATPTVLPSLFRETAFLADGIIRHVLLDPTKGATHYMTTALFNLNPPSWVAAMRLVATIGSQVFFK